MGRPEMLTARSLPIRCSFLSLRHLPIQSLLLVAMCSLPGALPAQVPQTKDIVHFHLHDKYLIIVDASVNDAGPFKFLVDTGTSRTVIDPSFARQLQAPVIGEVSLTGILHQRQDELVRLGSIRLGNVSMSNLGVVVDPLGRQKKLAPGTRGVLGEDFLSRFDFLINYEKHTLRFGGPAPEGKRSRFETIGQYRGEPTTNRLLISTEFMKASGDRVQLQLDTGARMVELFTSDQNVLPLQPSAGFMQTSGGTNETTIYPDIAIKIGATIIQGLDVVQSRRSIAFDAAGLLPAVIFHSIYISHSGGYVVLNPIE